MICVISDILKEKFLSKMVGDVLAAARSGQPFSTEGYIKDTYKQILDRTADRAKAQTFASFIPGNLISIFAANKEAGKYLTPSIAELATLRETFEDFDSVGTYLGIGQEAAQTKKQEIVEANEASLRVEEDPTAGASPAVVAGTAQPSNKSSISTSFKAAGKSALTAFNVVRPDADPIVVASESFIGKYHQAQKNGSAEYQGLKLKVVPARSIIADLPQSEREFLENTPSYEGVKAIIVNADNSPVRIDSQGNIAEEGVLAQYMLNRPELVDGVFVKKTETPISEVARALGVDESVAQEARQKEYRTLYNIRKALEQDPNREIYVGINTSGGFSVSMQYDNPVSLSDIDFKAFGEEFIPFVNGGTGKAFFELSFAKDPLPIDRPGITSVIPAETLAKYIFDESIPLATRKEVFESLLYTKDIKLREGQVLYKNQPVTEDVIASVLKSVTESARGSVNSTYRANVPLNTATTVDIPYYDQNGKVQYNTLDAVDYLKKYFTTPARLEETTAPYFNLNITPEEQIAFQADLESKPTTQPTVSAQPVVIDIKAEDITFKSKKLETFERAEGFEPVKGYGLKINGQPNADLFTYRDGKEWVVIDNKSKRKLPLRNTFIGNSPTKAEVIELLSDTLTYYVKQEKSRKVLEEVGFNFTQPTQASISVVKPVQAPLINANTAKPVGLQLDLDAITADIANKLKENIISNGLGATFNIQESIDSDITETISKGKQNSCK
jgi:hypothetical protein